MKLKRVDPRDFNDPFNAGQMIGMMMILAFIEKNPKIPKAGIESIKWACANNVSSFFDKHPEDIFLMVNSLINEIETL